MRNSSIDMILMGAFDNEDQTILHELGYEAKNRTVRVNFIVDKLIFHQFGNYVLQKIINVVQNNHLRTLILKRLNELSGDLSKTKHGSKVIQKLQK
jgi:hypothetical protein